MTTPRPHAELAARYYADDTMKCWVRDTTSTDSWQRIDDPFFNGRNLEYYVGHDEPLPEKE